MRSRKAGVMSAQRTLSINPTKLPWVKRTKDKKNQRDTITCARGHWSIIKRTPKQKVVKKNFNAHRHESLIISCRALKYDRQKNCQLQLMLQAYRRGVCLNWRSINQSINQSIDGVSVLLIAGWINQSINQWGVCLDYYWINQSIDGWREKPCSQGAIDLNRIIMLTKLGGIFFFLIDTAPILCDVVSKCHTFKCLLNTEWGKEGLITIRRTRLSYRVG